METPEAMLLPAFFLSILYLDDLVALNGSNDPRSAPGLLFRGCLLSRVDAECARFSLAGDGDDRRSRGWGLLGRCAFFRKRQSGDVIGLARAEQRDRVDHHDFGRDRQLTGALGLC